LKEIIIEAAKKAEKTTNERITMTILETVIKDNKPSVTLKEINKYVALKQKWDNEKGGKDDNDRTPIGFK